MTAPTMHYGKEAQGYNASLLEDRKPIFPDEEGEQQYEQLLSISDDGLSDI